MTSCFCRYAAVVRGFAPLEDGGVGPAESSGLIHERDVIVVVEWSDMWQRPYEQVIGRMRTAPDPVTLRVCGADALTSFIGQRVQMDAEADTEANAKDGSSSTSTSISTCSTVAASSSIKNGVSNGTAVPFSDPVQQHHHQQHTRELHSWCMGVLHITVSSAQSLSFLSETSSLGAQLAQGLLNLTGGAKGKGQGASPQGTHRCYFKSRLVI